MGKLDGKIALVTGGSTGIGFATAQEFIAEGVAHVYITGRRQEALDEAVKTLGHKHATGVQGDTSNLADLDKLYSLIKRRRADIWIFCLPMPVVVRWDPWARSPRRIMT